MGKDIVFLIHVMFIIASFLSICEATRQNGTSILTITSLQENELESSRKDALKYHSEHHDVSYGTLLPGMIFCSMNFIYY